MSQFNVQAALYQALAAVRQARACQWDTDKRCGVCEDALRRAEALLEDVVVAQTASAEQVAKVREDARVLTRARRGGAAVSDVERYEVRVTIGPCTFEHAQKVAGFIAPHVSVGGWPDTSAITIEELVPHDDGRRVRLEELARVALALDRDEQFRHDPFCADACGLPRWSAQPVKGCECGITAFLRAREALR